MLTVDFDRLGLQAGDRVLDMGCGGGRHAFEMYRRGADVIAFDQDTEELAKVQECFWAMKEAGEVPEGASAEIKEGDALALPFADGEFDRIVAAEVLEHIPGDIQAIGEHVRFVHDVSDEELVALMGSAEVACVPSLYEGFSLPTAELMACATPSWCS
jgi:cyclopropane fatty-acyl-phospholipid synthase-like methyltransferase